MSKTGAAFSVRFLKNGDQVIVSRNIINRNGEGCALFQVVDPTSGAVSPNWSTKGLSGDALNAVLDAQPIVQLATRSAAGFPSEITSVTWAYDGVTLNFAYNGATWVVAANDSRFQARINDGKYELQVIDNLASPTVVSNKQITYELNYICNAMTDSVQGDVDAIIQSAGSDSHVVQITTDHVEIDANNPTATLKAVAQYGTNNISIGSGGYTVKWYQDNVEIAGQTTNTLKVTRDMVEGGSIFVVKLFKDGSAVAQDSQRINDTADEYQITHKPTSAGSNYCAKGHNAVFLLALLRNNVEITDSVSFAWQVYNAIGEVTKSDGTGDTVTVTPDYCLVGTGQNAYYADCDVRVTADF